MRHLCILLVFTMTLSFINASTIFWECSSVEEFQRGKFYNTVLHSNGTISAGKLIRSFKCSESTLWSSILGKKGELYLGTGFQGRVYRFQNDKLERYFETKELIVTTMALNDKELYVGTIPSGKIFRVIDGKGKLLTQLSSKYIWSMKYFKGHLYAATGPKASLYKIDVKTKKVQRILRTSEKHFLSLEIDPKGNIYVGSAPRGILYKVSPEGKTFAVLDLPQNEIRALVYHQGTLYLGTNKSRNFDNAKMIQSLARKVRYQASKGHPLNRVSLFQRMMSSAVYEYRDGEGWSSLIEFKKNFITSLAPLGKGVCVGTGLNGKIYYVESKENWSILHNSKQNRIMTLSTDASGLKFFGTGGTSTLYQTVPKFFNTQVYYLSHVYDTSTFSRWGALYWRKKGRMFLQTRTGNTEKPDEFWSGWSIPYEREVSSLDSPSARYIQFRVRWLEPKAVLESIRILFRRQNRTPIIRSFQITGVPSTNTSKFFVPKKLNPLRISWKAKDLDRDELRYRLWLKHYQSGYWRELTAKEVYTKNRYRWDITHIPDGYYLLKLVVSDELENPSPKQASRVSPPILIDNHAPRVVVRRSKDKLKGEALDTFSIITQIAYRVGDGDWTLLEPEDKVFDSSQESFSFSIPFPQKKNYTIEIKALDAGGNAGYSFYTVK